MRNLGLLGDLHICQGTGAGHGTDEGIDLALLHQLLGYGNGVGRYCLVVLVYQLNGKFPVDSSGLVDLIYSHLNSV